MKFLKLSPDILLLLRLTFPMAKSPLSKRNKTPRTRNEMPNPAKPMPISDSVEKAKT